MYLQSSVEWHILTCEKRNGEAELPERMAWHSCGWEELLLRKERRWGGAWAVMSVHGGLQGAGLELKDHIRVFPGVPFVIVHFLEEKRQQIQSFRKISDNKREKPDLCCAFINCFTAVIAIGTSVYNACSITVCLLRAHCPLIYSPLLYCLV